MWGNPVLSILHLFSIQYLWSIIYIFLKPLQLWLCVENSKSIINNLREFQLLMFFFFVISLDCRFQTSMRYYLIMYLEWRAVQRIKIWNRKQCSNKFICTQHFHAFAIHFILLCQSQSCINFVFFFLSASLLTMYHGNNLTWGILNEPWWSGIMHLCSTFRFSDIDGLKIMKVIVCMNVYHRLNFTRILSENYLKLSKIPHKWILDYQKILSDKSCAVYENFIYAFSYTTFNVFMLSLHAPMLSS